MIIHIGIKELEEGFRDRPWELPKMYNIGIDYESNDIQGILDNEERCLFKFDKYDIKLSNRWGNYNISAGLAGITIEFTSD